MSEALLRLYVTTTSWVQDRYTGRKDRGATAVEYGILVGIIAVALITAVVLLGPRLTAAFQAVITQMPGGDDAGAGGQ